MEKSEIFVDLVRISQSEGYSYRIPEAIILNRKIITNRITVLDEDFYSPDRVFIIGHDSIERLQSFLEADIAPLPERIRNRYDSTLWWTDKDPYNSELRSSK